MESQRVVVVVEEAEAARAALQWAVHNFLRIGDSITLLHVHPFTRSKKQRKYLRQKGFQLALSFKDICNGVGEAKVEIIVREGDQTLSIISLVNEIGASTLVIGLHDKSFIYRVGAPSFSSNSLNCRIIAIKHHQKVREGFMNIDVSQVEIASLRMIETRRPLFAAFPFSLGTIWRRSKRQK